MNRTIVLLCLAAVGAAPAYAGEAAFDVTAYDVRIAPDFATQTVAGQTVVHFKSTAHGLKALSFSANALDVTASLSGENMVSAEVQGDRRVFHLPRAMRKGETGRLTVSFKGKAPKGLVWTADTVYANYFTCDYMICDQDRPGDKAKIDVRITLQPGMEVIAPGRHIATSLTRGAQTTHWRSRRPLSSYLFGFAAGKFQRMEVTGARIKLPVLAATSDSATVAQMFADTPRMLAFLEDKAGVRHPERAYTQVLVAGGEAQEAANHAIIGLANIAPILENPHEDWVIAHELAHQWWGNAVTCADWSELWLNEGLAVFVVAAWKESRWGRADYDRELELANKRWAAAKAEGFDVPLSWQGKYPSLKLKRAMAYAKSVVFLDTLRRELGEDAFWKGIKLYTRANWDKTVRAQDLQRALEHSSKRDLSALFAQWVRGPNEPPKEKGRR